MIPRPAVISQIERATLRSWRATSAGEMKLLMTIAASDERIQYGEPSIDYESMLHVLAMSSLYRILQLAASAAATIRLSQ